MKDKKWIIIILSALVLLTLTLAIFHLRTRETVPEGSVLITQNGDRRYAEPGYFDMVEVTGILVNGKGQTKEINARGIALKELASAPFESVTVTADDEYSAVVQAEEMENAFLILSEDSSVRLVVFGDGNAKRDVKNVVRVEFT